MEKIKEKEFLEEQIEAKEAEIAELENQIEQSKKYDVFKQAADDIHLIQRAFVEAGFSEEKAFELTREVVGSVSKPAPLLGGF